MGDPIIPLAPRRKKGGLVRRRKHFAMFFPRLKKNCVQDVQNEGVTGVYMEAVEQGEYMGGG